MNTLQAEEKSTETAAYRSYAGGYFKVVLSPEQTGGDMSIIDITLPKGAEPPRHMHQHEDETFYLLEGEVTFYIGDEETVAKPGEAVFGPRGVPHKFTLHTPQARMLTVITPGNFVNFFMDFSQPLAGELKVTPPQGPPPPETIEYIVKQATEKYGTLFV